MQGRPKCKGIQTLGSKTFGGAARDNLDEQLRVHPGGEDKEGGAALHLVLRLGRNGSCPRGNHHHRPGLGLHHGYKQVFFAAKDKNTFTPVLTGGSEGRTRSLQKCLMNRVFSLLLNFILDAMISLLRPINRSGLLFAHPVCPAKAFFETLTISLPTILE